MRFQALALLIILSLVITACTGDDDDTDDMVDPGDAPTPTVPVEASPTPEPTPVDEPPAETPSPVMTPDPEETPTPEADPATPTTEPGTPEADADIPQSPVGERFAWVLGEMNEGGEGLTPDVVEENFAPEVLEQVPAEVLGQQIREFAASYGPFTFEGFWSPPDPSQATAIVSSQVNDSEFLVNIAVEEDEPHRITGFNFQPVPAPATFDSWDDFEQQFATLAGEASFTAVEITADGIEPVHSLAADELLAIGSTFKLYVLGELARQIEAGEAAWDEEMAIEEEWKTLPSGTMQNEPAGETFTLQRYAELMISISDNTATDHLIHQLGRENVEAVQSEMGHDDPERNVPFLLAHDVFVLKLALPEEQVEAYLAASPDERREMLETEIASTDVSLADAAGWMSPRYIDEIEWFASTNDLARAMAWLHDARQEPGLEPIGDILSLNPGVPIDEDTWAWVGLKGGSEPGVLNLTWLLERADGRTFVLSATLNDETQPVDEMTAIEQLMGAIALLAEQE